MCSLGNRQSPPETCPLECVCFLLFGALSAQVLSKYRWWWGKHDMQFFRASKFNRRSRSDPVLKTHYHHQTFVDPTALARGALVPFVSLVSPCDSKLSSVITNPSTSIVRSGLSVWRGIRLLDVCGATREARKPTCEFCTHISTFSVCERQTLKT